MKNIFAISLVLLIAGCSKEQIVDNNKKDIVLELINNPVLFTDAAKLRGNENFSSLFFIDEIVRTGNILKIMVSHTYACSGNYEVIWNGEIMESFPYQIRLYVKFIANCSKAPTIAVMVNEVLDVDLSSLIKDSHVLDNLIVHVSNASSNQDVSSDDPVNN